MPKVQPLRRTMKKRLAVLIAACALGIAAVSAAGAAGNAPQAAQASAGDSKVTIPVEGLTCAACSPAVRRALKKMGGVKGIGPGPQGEGGGVTHHPSHVKPE